MIDVTQYKEEIKKVQKIGASGLVKDIMDEFNILREHAMLNNEQGFFPEDIEAFDKKYRWIFMHEGIEFKVPENIYTVPEGKYAENIYGKF